MRTEAVNESPGRARWPSCEPREEEGRSRASCWGKALGRRPAKQIGRRGDGRGFSHGLSALVLHGLSALVLAALVSAAALAPVSARAAQGDRALALDRSARQDARSLPWLGLRLGGLIAVNSLANDAPTAGGVSGYALFDGRDFLADVNADLYFGDNARFFAAGLGAYYPFALANITPYLGGGLKVGWTRFGGDGTFGIIPYAALGVLFGREGYVQVRGELAWFVALSREDRPATAARPADSARSHGPMLTLGLAF